MGLSSVVPTFFSSAPVVIGGGAMFTTYSVGGSHARALSRGGPRIAGPRISGWAPVLCWSMDIACDVEQSAKSSHPDGPFAIFLWRRVGG